MRIDGFLADRSGEMGEIYNYPGKPAMFIIINKLGLSAESIRYFEQIISKGINRNDGRTLAAYIYRENICLTTTPASGKNNNLFVAAIEELCHNPKERIQAILLLQALG